MLRLDRLGFQGVVIYKRNVIAITLANFDFFNIQGIWKRVNFEMKDEVPIDCLKSKPVFGEVF